MKMRFDLGAWSRMLFFALLPWLSTVAVLGVSAFLSVAGYLSFRPSLVRQVIEKRPLPLLFLLAFAGWATLSCLWSIYPDHIQALKLWLTLAGGLMFAGSGMRRTFGPTADQRGRPGGVSCFGGLAWGGGALGTAPSVTPSIPNSDLGYRPHHWPGQLSGRVDDLGRRSRIDGLGRRYGYADRRRGRIAL